MSDDPVAAKITKIKLYSFFIAAVFASVAIGGYLFYFQGSRLSSKGKEKVSQKDKGDKKKKGDKKDKEDEAAGSGDCTPYQGGTFESSGVAYVPGSDGILFVDDSKPAELFWMKLDSSGHQSGDIRPIALDVGMEDPEDMTFDGSYFYIVCSQTNPKSNKQTGLVRFSFDAANQTIQASAISGLRDFLVTHVPELKSEGAKAGKDNGLNIEGIAWDPNRNALLLGLRSPLVNDEALVVAVKLRDPNGSFSADNLVLAQPDATRLPLNGQGIRGFEYDIESQSFLIIAGATEQQKKTDFTLWQWSGNGSPRQTRTFDSAMKPEDITRVKGGDSDFLLVVGDASCYLRLDE